MWLNSDVVKNVVKWKTKNWLNGENIYIDEMEYWDMEKWFGDCNYGEMGFLMYC